MPVSRHGSPRLQSCQPSPLSTEAGVLITGQGLYIQARPDRLLAILRRLARSYATLGDLPRLARH